MQIFVEMGWSFQGIFKKEKDGNTCGKVWVNNVKCRNASFMAA